MTVLPDISSLSDQEAAKVVEMIERAEQSQWKPFYCPDRNCPGTPHNNGDNWNYNHARPKQRPPDWNGRWQSLIVKSGRGFGKTEMGSRITHQVAKRAPFMALIAPTGPDIREAMVEGPTGILATANPNFTPIWEPSRKRLVWPNGSIALGLSAEEPDRIRSKNLAFAWLDEAAFMDNIDRVWSNLMFALRIKYGIDRKPIRNHVLITTTPTPSKWIKARVADPKNIVVSGSTYENIENLSEEFKDEVLGEYEGTRQGRQEIYGEILEDVEGALWLPGMLHYIEEKDLPEFERIVVAVDPAGSANPRSDATGIVVVAVANKNYYVLADRTDKYSPAGWAEMAHKMFERYNADAIVAEKNYGGEMVEHTLKSVDLYPRVIPVDSRRGKTLRAEPVVGLYEKGLVFHVKGMVDLETEMTEWVPGPGSPSPNRVDALVHGVTALVRGASRAANMASPANLRPASNPLPFRRRRSGFYV